MKFSKWRQLHHRMWMACHKLDKLKAIQVACRWTEWASGAFCLDRVTDYLE